MPVEFTKILSQIIEAFLPFLDNDIDISEFYDFPHPDYCTYTPDVPDPSCQQ